MFAVACCWGLAWAQPADLSQEPALQRRITVWVKMEPLRDALRTLSNRLGVALRCQDAIADEKVAVFVRERPAHEILTQLAAALRYAWRKDEGAYVLYMPDETRLQEEKAARALEVQRRQFVYDVVALTREISRLPVEQRRKLREQAAAENARDASPRTALRSVLLYLLTPQPIQHWTGSQMEPDVNVLQYPALGVVYLCLASLPDAAIERLLQGETIGLSSKPASNIYATPPDALLPSYQRNSRWATREGNLTLTFESRNPDFWGVWIRYSPFLGGLQSEIISITQQQPEDDSSAEARPMLQRYPYRHLPPYEYLRRGGYGKFWDDWASEPNALEAALPDQPRSKEPLPPLPDYAESPALARDIELGTTADALEYLAIQAQMPVIADALRGASIAISRDGFTPRRSLTQLREHLWLRLEGDYLLGRHRDYWERRTLELPEATLRRLEQKAAREPLTLNDYIELAGQLSEAQVRRYMETETLSLMLTRFNIEPLIACLPALHFLASLAPAQRRALESGEWLIASQFNPTQQRRFLTACGDDFPPPQALFREPLPRTDTPRQLANRTHTLGETLFPVGDTDDESAPRPESPAVRLSPRRETTGFLLVSEGMTYYLPPTSGDTGAGQLPQHVQDLLERHPDSRLLKVPMRGWVIEFLAPSGESKQYLFVIANRPEPYKPPAGR